MKRTHALIVAVAVAFAAIAGTFAALRTTQLGSNATRASRVSVTQIASQNRALGRAERTLLAELRKQPPALPPLPASRAPVSAPAAVAPQTVIYRRPPAIVHVIHRHSAEHDHETERSNGGGGDD
jgi:hypothetical protein